MNLVTTSLGSISVWDRIVVMLMKLGCVQRIRNPLLAGTASLPVAQKIVLGVIQAQGEKTLSWLPLSQLGFEQFGCLSLSGQVHWIPLITP